MQEDLLRSDARADRQHGWSHWIITWNNPPDDCWLQLQTRIEPDYIIGQLERAPTTGTVHVQAYVYIKRYRTLRFWKSKIPSIAAFGKSPTAAKDLIAYCTKEDSRIPDSFHEFGRPPRMDGRALNNATVYQQTLDSCKEGKWEDAIAEHQVKYFGNLTKLSAHYAKGIDFDRPRGIWLDGVPGSGKSYFARHQSDAPFYIKSQSKWWDNYRGEPVVILDDFDKQGSKLSHYLKIWLDQYAFKGEIKGGTVSVAYTQFIITSNYTPEEIFGTDDSALIDAIRRRCRFGTVDNRVVQWADE